MNNFYPLYNCACVNCLHILAQPLQNEIANLLTGWEKNGHNDFTLFLLIQSAKILLLPSECEITFVTL